MKAKYVFCLVLYSLMIQAQNCDSTYMRLNYQNDFLLFNIDKADGFSSDKQDLSYSNSINVNFLSSKHFALTYGFTLFTINYLNSYYLDFINMTIKQKNFKYSYGGPTIGFKYYSIYKHFGFFTSLRVTGFSVSHLYLDEYDHKFHSNMCIDAGCLYALNKWTFGLGVSTGSYYVHRLNTYKPATGITTIIGWRFL